MTGRTLIEVRRYRLAEPSLVRLLLARFGDSIGSTGADVGLFTCDQDPLIVVTISEYDDFDSLAAGRSVFATNAEVPCEAVDVSIVRSFATVPRVERRFAGAERRYQLRIYEHPHVAAGETKIEMFETAEIEIFRRVGLNPVFFGQAIAGPDLPNLTYLLGFDDDGSRRHAWAAFVNDPRWMRLSAIPRYADALLIRRITNLNLTPAEGSAF